MKTTALGVPGLHVSRRAFGTWRLGGAGGLDRTSLLPLSSPPLLVGVAVAGSFIAVESALLVGLEGIAPAESFGVLYLLGVVVVSTLWGTGLSVATSVLSAVAFDVFRAWPHRMFGPLDLENTIRLVAFVVVALLTNFVAGMARTSRHRANELAQQQAGLRRVATLVARAVSPSQLFTAVAEEMAGCLRAHSAVVGRYDGDGTVTFVATGRSRPAAEQTLNLAQPSITLDEDSVAARVLHSGQPARMSGADYDASPQVRQAGIRCAVGVPIRVGGRVWGVAAVASPDPEALPVDTEARLGDFAELVATAIANAATRAELIASRARIVKAADDARRQFERDLHDGAQQRLVSLALGLRLAEESVPPGAAALKVQLAQAASALKDVCDDLREISHGLHPGILTRGGLAAALKTLARRSAVPVTLNATVDRRLPEAVEVAAYYVVAEALTNVAKHARAYMLSVSASIVGNTLELSIQDDGIGGAASGRGSGLIGLIDRVEALGGALGITSEVGAGTTLRATIPVGPE
jgi:signal transduction histidine kinase